MRSLKASVTSDIAAYVDRHFWLTIFVDMAVMIRLYLCSNIVKDVAARGRDCPPPAVVAKQRELLYTF